MTPAKLLTNKFRIRCGELWPDTVRLEETGVGDAVPIAFVRQAIACIEAGNPRAALPILNKRVKFGIKGQCDLTGFVVRDLYGVKIPQYTGIEIKATPGEKISDDQKNYHEYLRSFGAIVIVVRSLEQGIADLREYAGPGVERL